MGTLTSEETVGELVSARLGRSRVFEEYGIDYCCGGGRSLAEACTRKGVSVEEVICKLNELDGTDTPEPATDYASMPLDELVEHIVTTHHAYLRTELPRLEQMATKVAKVHGETDARLVELRDVVQGLVAELTSHMMKEEQVLFPIIRRLVQGDTETPMHCGSLSNPIGAMEAEHESAGRALEDICQLTDGHTPPDWACGTYRVLLDGLRELELDLHQHIHKENNILFPGALAI